MFNSSLGSMGGGNVLFTGLLAATILASPAALHAEVMATYELRPALTNGNVLTFDLLLNFGATEGEQLVYFGLDVSGSAAALTQNGTDFTAFSFAKAMPLLEGWNQIPNASFGAGPFRYAAEFETVTRTLLPSRYALGALSVDFTQSGLATIDASLVNITGRDSVIGTELPAQSGTFQFHNVVVVPEPSCIFLLFGGAMAGVAGVGRWKRRRIARFR